VILPPTVFPGRDCIELCYAYCYRNARNTKVGSITVPLTSCLAGLDFSVLQIKTKIVSSHTADPKPVKQEINSTLILPPLVFPGMRHLTKAHALAYSVLPSVMKKDSLSILTPGLNGLPALSNALALGRGLGSFIKKVQLKLG
jgi:hypothetical protein